MKIIYCVYGEDELEDYKGMWQSGKKDEGRQRLFRFDFLARQTLFSIKSLRLWDKDVLVEIHTNKPEYFKKQHNVNILDMKEVYKEYRYKPYWCYIIKFEAIARANDSFLFLDGDTWFKGFDKKDLNPGYLYCDTEMNYGVIGMHRSHLDMCQKMVDNIKTANFDTVVSRSATGFIVDPFIVNSDADNLFIKNIDGKLKKHQCKKFIFHYWKKPKWKNIIPPDSMLKIIKKTGTKQKRAYYETE